MLRSPRALALLLVAVCASSLASDGRAQAGDPLVVRLRQIVADAGLGEQVGISVVDVRDGRPVFQHHAERPLNPASNQKIITAAAALRLLGPEFTMRTMVYGRPEGGRASQLVLQGQGDPTLRMSDLIALARDVADQGVTAVDRVIIDASYFDDQTLPTAFEQQPNEVAAFRAPISAVALERNAYVLRILPGPSAGAPARVRLLGEPHFALDNQITTSAEGAAPNVIAVQRDTGEQLDLRLRGTVPLGIRGVSYRRRIENPLPWVGQAFAEALGAAGIRFQGPVEVGAAPSGLALLASRESPPLAEQLPALGKWSDNFVAEMLFRVIGAERHRPGRSEDSVAAVSAFLGSAGLPADRIEIVNGSGLFEGNRVAAQHLADLLAYMYRDEGLRPEFLSHFAIGGVDGTLRRRMRDFPVPRVVRAKTGTLNDVISLSGYVIGRTPDRAFAFSVLTNGVRGRQGQARALGDQIARVLVEHLHGR